MFSKQERCRDFQSFGQHDQLEIEYVAITGLDPRHRRSIELNPSCRETPGEILLSYRRAEA